MQVKRALIIYSRPVLANFTHEVHCMAVGTRSPAWHLPTASIHLAFNEEPHGTQLSLQSPPFESWSHILLSLLFISVNLQMWCGGHGPGLAHTSWYSTYDLTNLKIAGRQKSLKQAGITKGGPTSKRGNCVIAEISASLKYKIIKNLLLHNIRLPVQLLIF